MGRPSKNSNKEIEIKGDEEGKTKDDATIQESAENPEETIAEVNVSVMEIPANIDRLMRLYPQYEKIYVTKEGFVHPEDAPAILVKEATLYANKYYNKQ